eukprot:1153759-Pelagomonas_calceolata.AAC.2
MEVIHCEDTRPENQLKASKQQHCDPCRDLSRASAQITLHTTLLGVGELAYKLASTRRDLENTVISQLSHRGQALGSAGIPPDPN